VALVYASVELPLASVHVPYTKVSFTELAAGASAANAEEVSSEGEAAKGTRGRQCGLQ